MRNKVNPEAFWRETEQNEDLSKCFDEDVPFNKQSKNWKNTFDDILKKCFKKIRIVKKKITRRTTGARGSYFLTSIYKVFHII